EVLKDNNDPRRTEVMASEDKKEALFRFLLPLYSTTGWGGNVHTPATFTTFKDFTQWFACDDREWNKDINNTKN
ncbi:MAG: hypothetical protein LBD75_04745, partial [Candidatus Peribacteria bacterium]|nr:hypothetical protein [Candidatus Peribacteria bacterium]